MAMKKNEDSTGTPPLESTQSGKSTRARKVGSSPTAEGKALSGTEEKVEAVAKKARKTAIKVATAVSETVKEIAEKVSRKTTTGTKKAAGSGAKSAGTTRASSAPGGKKAGSSTRVGALTPGVTDEDVRQIVGELANSESIPDESQIEDESATDVRQHFFHDQHLHQGPPPAHAPRTLPDEYGDTKLVLLVRDPEWVYAYWEINDETRRELSIPRNGHDKRLVLRIFKITGREWPDQPAHYFFDVEVNRDAKSWYVHLPEASESWCSELGVLDDLQNFLPICRSNAFITPRNSISEHVDSEWMTVEESFEKITRLSATNMDARLRGDAAAASESILRNIQRQLTGVLHGERSSMSSGIFSSESPIIPSNKGFWLHVDTELILYGATEPDATVTVQGKPVKLNADGTFSLRFALPDGEQSLEVVAVNSSNDMEESITPVVNRRTR